MESNMTLLQLNKVIRQCRHTPFYQERLPFDSLTSFEDFWHIPLTTKADLRKSSPYGLISVPQTELFQYHESFGTTGTPVSVWLTREDYQINAEELALWGVCFHPHDVVLIRFPYSISAVAHTVTTAAQLRGACVVPAGARSKVTPFPRIIDLLRKLKVSVLACLPLQALLIAETADLMKFEPLKDFPNLRAICTAGETLSPGRRQTLESIWGVPVFDNYGMTEIGAAVVDCQYQHPHPLEDYYYFEILREDLQTHAPVGEIGFLVITTLKRRGMPLIRYLTGDLARWIPVRCPCGAQASIEIRGRAEDVIRLENHRLDLWDLENLVSRLPYRRFWVAAPRDGQLEIIVEEEKTTKKSTSEHLTQVHDTLEKEFGVPLSIRIVPRGTLYDRDELLSIGEVGKPKYLYTAQEMAEQKYIKSARV